MPKKYKMHVKEFVIALLVNKRRTIRQVMEFTGISRSTIWRWRVHGTIEKVINRKRPKSEAASSALLGILDRRCCITQQEIVNELASQGVQISSKSIHTIFQRHRITRKRVKRRRQSVNCTPESKAVFKDKWNAIMSDGNDVLFQDESHFSQNILPLYGYSQAGHPCYVQETSKRDSHTLIFAFSKSGSFFYKVYSGSMNTARMQWFVDSLPPIRILMDNLAIHKCVHTHVEKIFTPVAQPYANPAEIVFSKIEGSTC
jgi:transposase